jgi:hypothetical protein
LYACLERILSPPVVRFFAAGPSPSPDAHTYIRNKASY